MTASSLTTVRLLFFVLASAFASFIFSGCSYIPSAVRSDKRGIYKYEPAFTIEEPPFVRSAESLGKPMVGGNDAKILKNGDEIFPPMLRDIREAKHTVNLETFIFKPDAAGQQFAEAFMSAARRGVKVRILLDAFGSSLSLQMKKDFKDAGVIVFKYRPLKIFTAFKVTQRTHRKILVVDGRVAYTGGLGIQESWLGNARNTKEWRDTQVRVEGPVVAQMQSIFSEDWTYTTGEILAGDFFYPHQEHKGDITAQAIKASRGDSSSLPKMFYFMAIRSATKSIHIANAYFLPDDQVREELTKAVKRGIDVQIMVPGRHIDQKMVRSASWHHYGELLKGGVKIYEYRPTMLHNKTLVVDGIYSTIGSINFDGRSMNGNAEESIAFYDHEFAQRMEAMYEEDKKKCDEITLATWRHRGAHKRLAELVFWIWEPYY